ncbi:hypothetical protein [Bradyrhizobium neotropicale]|uniref:Uncharacterized protein n=1 Tax=Bradyrhizobium neotropicale TaxID=1497615 RepID=A0A176Z3P6_9BRAD|nr:hypothetical protein [Bradyrhizobium neotropicale]OAF14114.1 hypothetical protein AXW67_00525 [Bradyrhizobium neotropicale]
MANEALAGELNALADLINRAAEKLGAIGRIPAVDALRMRVDRHAMPSIAPGSPLARMVEQGDRFAATMPEPAEPTKWEPSECRCQKP